jgi:hypothetical protein
VAPTRHYREIKKPPTPQIGAAIKTLRSDEIIHRSSRQG